MARIRGTFNIGSNYESSVRRPFDARMLVTTFNDLTIKDNWYLKEPTTGEVTTTCIAYNGMIVAVADKTDEHNSGLYMLYDKSSGKTPDVELKDNWVKIGETTDIASIVDRLDGIDKTLEDLESRVEFLENDSVINIVDKSQFPTVGEVGKLYVDVAEQASYVYLPDIKEYVCVGKTSKMDDPEVISGGNATSTKLDD